MTLEIVMGDLREGYSQLEPGMFQHGDELMAGQVKNPALLGYRLFYIADFPMYSLDKWKPILWLARHTPKEPNNLILFHLDDVANSYDQLVKNQDYQPFSSEAQHVMQAKSTLRVDMTQLRLQGKGQNPQYLVYLVVDTTHYNRLNVEERKLAEGVYGRNDAFVRAMRTLKGAGLGAIKIHLLHLDYVRQYAQHGPIARAALRSNISDADTFLNVCGVHGRNSLRGIPLPVSTGTPPP